jgi:DNA-binding CsgD family transcriptional regulator
MNNVRENINSRSFKGGNYPNFSSKDLAILWRIPFPSETDANIAPFALIERIKELNCLYGVSKLAEKHPLSLDDLLQELVNFLPYSWQYPDIACARIFFKGKTFTSEDFKTTNWRQSSRIYMYHEAVGECAIFYLEECPPSDEGPFLKEERALIDAVAEQIGNIATRILVDMELQETNNMLILEQKALQETNTALKVVLARIEQEKQEIYRDINMNIEKILMPILQTLSSQLPDQQKKYLEILKRNLEEITSPFINKLSTSFRSMTPTEVSICNMIKDGMRTKEIAETRGISEATVNRHREKIRSKLGITNQDVNLTTFLQSNLTK